MIARVWRGAVRLADGGAYAEYMRETGVAGYAKTPGNLGVWMLRRDLDERTEFVMFTLWESLDAVKAFAGEDYEIAVFYPEDERFLIERDLRAAHFDVDTSERGPLDLAPRLLGRKVVLRPLRVDDVERVAKIQAEPGVARWWGPPNEAELRAKAEGGVDEKAFAIEREDELVGLIEFHEENEPDFRHVGIDLFLTERAQGHGVGPDALRTLARYLIEERGHHRLTIDPAAEIDQFPETGLDSLHLLAEGWDNAVWVVDGALRLPLSATSDRRPRGRA